MSTNRHRAESHRRKAGGDKRSMQRRRARKSPVQPVEQRSEGMRLNRYIAQAGVCSRRKADELIADGRVTVNGVVVTEFATQIREGDQVAVAGKVISPQQFEYVLLNKPSKTITTTSDERGRKTVLDLVDSEELRDLNIFPVGRLDRDTVGVLLLTNDGELANRLMHPSYEVAKLYLVETKDSVKPHQLDLLKRGVKLDDGLAQVDNVIYMDPPNRQRLGVELHEGRNRQIRRMFEELGHEVVHLERVRYAGLTTQGVRRGKWRRLRSSEIRALRASVKLK